MPNCFQLIDKQTNHPVAFNEIDELICKLLNRKVDPIKYCYDWYNSIGFCLAMGRDWNWIKKQLDEPINLKIINFLEANYNINTWAEN